MQSYPYPEYDGVRSIVLGIIVSILTCGIYYFYWQYKQMETLNAWLGGRSTTSGFGSSSIS